MMEVTNAGVLSVVMPCYNEAKTVEGAALRVLASPYTGQLIIVDDASTDGTPDALKRLSDPRIKVIRQPFNRGKGAAVREGFRLVTLPFVVIQDADGEYDPADFRTLLEPLFQGKADVVYGSRFSSSGARRVLYFWHSLGNRFLTTVSNLFTNLNLTDMETCYKAFRLEVLSSFEIQEDRFGIEPEITAKLARGGWRIYEVGISYDGRTYEEGKKIGWKDGFRALYCIVKYSAILNPSRPSPEKRKDFVGFDSGDEHLADTLDSLDGAKNYASWIYSMIEPFLGNRVLEIGAGHGTFTKLLLRSRTVTATDFSSRCVQRLKEQFAEESRVNVVHSDVTEDFDLGVFESAVLTNVLEHLDDDKAVLTRLKESLVPGGHVIVFVPAFPSLYSEFDGLIGHRRRYRRRALGSLAESAGYHVVVNRYVNSIGFFGWWLIVKQLRQTPKQSPLVQVFDRVIVPVLSTVERRWAPPFGQSLLLVARRTAD